MVWKMIFLYPGGPYSQVPAVNLPGCRGDSSEQKISRSSGVNKFLVEKTACKHRELMVKLQKTVLCSVRKVDGGKILPKIQRLSKINGRFAGYYPYIMKTPYSLHGWKKTHMTNLRANSLLKNC